MEDEAYLSVIDLAGAEQSVKRVIARNDKPGKVHQELAGDIKEDEEEIYSDEAEKGIDLWHRGLLFKIV